MCDVIYKVPMEKYVIMLPREQPAIRFYIRTPYGAICVFTNLEKLAEVLVPPSMIQTDLTGMSPVANLCAFFDSHAMVDQEIRDGKFLERSDPRYIPNVENTLYHRGDTEFFVYQYPFKGILCLFLDMLCGSVTAASEESLILLTRMALKKMIVRLYATDGYYPLHAAAVGTGNSAYIFVAGGRAGKSTIFMKLLEYGYIPINDDLVFIKETKDGLNCTGFPIIPSVRKESVVFLNSKLENIPSLRGFEGEYYVNVWHSEFDPYKTYRLVQLYYPEYGYKEFCVFPPKPDLMKKRLIKSFFSHQQVVIDKQEQAVNVLNKLLHISALQIQNTEDMDAFAKGFPFV